MTDAALLGTWIRRFLLDYLVSECNLARNTQQSYRDTLSLLLPFAAQQIKKDVDQIAVIDVSADVVRHFLQYLEDTQKWNSHPEPAVGSNPLIGSLHWSA